MSRQLSGAIVLKRIWHDPVWSKVIATGIIAIIAVSWVTVQHLGWAYIWSVAACLFTLILGIVIGFFMSRFLTSQQPRPTPNIRDVDITKKWLLASDNATIKELVPGEILQQVEAKKQTAHDSAEEYNQIHIQLLASPNPPDPSLKAKDDQLETQWRQAAGRERAAKQRIEEYTRELLAKGKLIARGIPNEAPPHDNEQVIIKPAQWRYLRLAIFAENWGLYPGQGEAGDAVDSKGAPVFKGVEIGKPKGQQE